MLTRADMRKLEVVFATKEDFRRLIQNHVTRLEMGCDLAQEKIDRIMAALIDRRNN